MSNHLSEDQFANYAVGRSTSAERQHVIECRECRTELDRFGAAVSSFRSAIGDRVDARLAARGVAIMPLSRRPAASGISTWRWALVATLVVVAVLIPLLTKQAKPPEVIEKVSIETDPDALMRAVNLHLSRTIPEPMERMMTLIPNDESVIESGGTQ